MSNLSRKLMMGAAGAAGEKVYVEDVFSTWLYTGNSSTQTITNGIDLAGEGGMVWLKVRSEAQSHALFDTNRGPTKLLGSNHTDPEGTLSGVSSFSSSGFTLGSFFNSSPQTYASWTFRKAEKFFDVVTYTGDGVAGRTVAHNLGSVPGMIIVKATSRTGSWLTYHRSLGATKNLKLNLTDAESTLTEFWNDTSPTATEFSVGTNINVNENGATYVAYLFAHDAGGFGDSGDESVIKCGSFTTPASGFVSVDLGWEPQWVLLKCSSQVQSWRIFDNMRGMYASGNDSRELLPDTLGVEATGQIELTSNGFRISSSAYGASRSFVYIAIRRGPMKTPEDATEVFAPIAATGANGTTRTTDFPVDLQMRLARGTPSSRRVYTRLLGVSVNSAGTGAELYTDSASIESTGVATTYNWWNTGYTENNTYNTLSAIAWNFRRAPGFFDVVAYTGTGASITVNHNLGVTPELIIGKCRTYAFNWIVYHQFLGTGAYISLNTDEARTLSSLVSAVSPTSFTGEANAMSSSGDTHIAYLFATAPGVSKVGSYAGTGTTLNVDCGFTAGARFVLIKRTDSTGDWYVWDSARGIVAGNDPYLLLNSTAAEVTSTDYVDTYSAGFEISSTAPAAINASGGSYIFLAVA